jgi:hypothetical protein
MIPHHILPQPIIAYHTIPLETHGLSPHPLLGRAKGTKEASDPRTGYKERTAWSWRRVLITCHGIVMLEYLVIRLNCVWLSMNILLHHPTSDWSLAGSWDSLPFRWLVGIRAGCSLSCYDTSTHYKYTSITLYYGLPHFTIPYQDPTIPYHNPLQLKPSYSTTSYYTSLQPTTHHHTLR